MAFPGQCVTDYYRKFKVGVFNYKLHEMSLPNYKKAVR